MPKLEFMFLCETTLTDQHGLHSYINLIDGVYTDQYPFSFPKVALAASIFQGPAELKKEFGIRISLTKPDGSEMFNTKLDVKNAGPRHRFSLNITPLNLEMDGSYIFELFANFTGEWEKLGNTTLVSKKVDRPPEGEIASA